jgi:hypothetical protein
MIRAGVKNLEGAQGLSFRNLGPYASQRLVSLSVRTAMPSSNTPK